MRKTIKKVSPRIINYRLFRNFSNEAFINLSKEVFVHFDDGLEKFCKATMHTLSRFAPIKDK